MEHMGSYLQSFLPFAQKRLGFNRPPTIFFDSDAENSKKVLGKTGYYDPDASEIVIFVDNRHPKDILRSLSHELVHHAQNCRGDLNPEIAGETELGYAQNNAHMRGMESEAYEKGNLCMRDWEDSVKLQLQETNYLHTKGDTHKMATYDELKEQITKNVVQQLIEKVKNPGKYAGGAKQSAGVDDDGDGVPDGADKDPQDGSIQEGEDLDERKKRDEPRNDRGVPQRLKEDEDEEEELEERKKRDEPRNDRGISQRLKEDESEEDNRETIEEEEDETLDEWYQNELYQKLINRWIK